MKKEIEISVIVPTKNEEKNINRLLLSLHPIRSNPEWEVLVVDNYSTDATYDIAKKWGAKVYKKGPERSAQKNYGAARAKGSCLIFLDADMKVEKESFFKEVEALGKKINTNSYIIPEISIATTTWDAWRGYYRKFVTNDLMIEAPRIFSKRNFQQVQGYDEKLNACEDWDIRDRIRTISGLKRMKQSILHYENISHIVKHLSKKFYYGTYLPLYLKKQKIGMMSGETIYFLRPSYFKMIQTFSKHPFSVLGATLLLTLEAGSGFLGFLYGKYYTR